MSIPWRPISEAELWDDINQSWDRMSWPQRRLWNAIRITPEKWQLHPWGDEGEGFWVVAILGKTVVWFNDIEDGFNRSQYNEFGLIRDYWCNQDELEVTVQCLLNEIMTGQASGGLARPPQAID